MQKCLNPSVRTEGGRISSIDASRRNPDYAVIPAAVSWVIESGMDTCAKEPFAVTELLLSSSVAVVFQGEEIR